MKPDQDLGRAFDTLWMQVGGQSLTTEHRFDTERKFRFDRAYLEAKVAIEIDGATWANGRHTREPGYSHDCEKINLAQSQGWLVFRLTRPMLECNPHYHLTMIKNTIAARLRDAIEIPCQNI